MGWQEAEAQTALRRSGHDVGTAAALLETEEEERKELMTKVWVMREGLCTDSYPNHKRTATSP